MLSIRKNLISANHFATKKLANSTNESSKFAGCFNNTRPLHTSQSNCNLAAAAILPIPHNIDVAETTRFSPNRARDITANFMLSQYGSNCVMDSIDITADTSQTAGTSQLDPHVQCYDCFGAVALNSAMQSNVPTPFGGMHRFSHLNMPGGQWSQESKFTAQNLQSSHYLTLREQVRAKWLDYNQNAIVQTAHATNNNNSLLSPLSLSPTIAATRSYSTKTEPQAKQEEPPKTNVLSKKEQLKRAFKEYGATIVVFHVGISLLSLGGFYLLVSGGIDMMPVLDYLGLSTAVSNKVATGASTFVVAYAIHKVFAPVRISITLGAAPFIVRYLRSKGLLKPKIVKQK